MCEGPAFTQKLLDIIGEISIDMKRKDQTIQAQGMALKMTSKGGGQGGRHTQYTQKMHQGDAADREIQRLKTTIREKESLQEMTVDQFVQEQNKNLELETKMESLTNAIEQTKVCENDEDAEKQLQCEKILELEAQIA